MLAFTERDFSERKKLTDKAVEDIFNETQTSAMWVYDNEASLREGVL